ncbi:MAG TPA: alkaline phosphatase family protein [Terriglobales bacterium]|nr:alkaline phosphatase family protein [Terriglobales bacterium]
MSISPASTSVSVGSTEQFTANVTGTADTAVTWNVNGVAGGNSSAGIITSSGLYSAPSTVPPNAAVQVSAVSQADSSKSAAASVTITHLQIGHVFLVIEENHGYSAVIGSSSMPWLNSLASQFGLATNYYANSHPSIGNYFMLTTGQLVTTDDSFTGTVDVDNLARELIAAGKTWKSYAESLPSAGYTGGDSYPYLERHNPFSYFSDVRNSAVQRQNLVPFTQFSADLANNQLPVFSYIVPNAEHDAHDCPGGGQSCSDTLKLSAADAWLKANLGPLLSSTLFQKDGLLVIVFDEAATSDNSHGGGHVAMLVLGPAVKPAYQSSTFYQHQDTLRLLVNSTGAAAAPGSSANTSSMSEFLR